MRTRLLGRGDGPLVMLLHGFGAPGDDLVSLAGALRLPPSARFAFPEAPIDLGFGRAWWMIDTGRFERALSRPGGLAEIAAERPEGLEKARDGVLELVDSLAAEHGLSSDRFVLGGFSQGAMLSLEVALALAGRSPPARPAGLVLWSGTVIAETHWRSLAADRRLQGLPVVLAHGRQDPLLPYGQAEVLRELLASAGALVTWVPFDGGHTIPVEAIEATRALVARLL